MNCFLHCIEDFRIERGDTLAESKLEHLERVVKAYRDFKDEPCFAAVVPVAEIRAKDGNLSIPLYVASLSNKGSQGMVTSVDQPQLAGALSDWLSSTASVRHSLNALFSKMEDSK